MADLPFYILVLVLGGAVGSFLNVLIYRLPRNLPFIAGRSFCPACKSRIRFYDNIPLLSYLILRGKCRSCKARISLRYPLVELLNGAAYLFFLTYFGLTAMAAVYAALSSVLIVIFFIDLEFQIIPDWLTLPGMVLGLGASFLPGGIGVVGSVIGLIVGGVALYMVALLGDWLFKKESMGGGDIKMAAMLGAFLGWQKVILVFIGAAVIGLVMAVVWMMISRRVRSSRMIPFGPFLAIAAVGAILFGDRLISLYISHFLQM